MFALLRFLKGYRKQAVLAPLFKLFEAILELLVPLCVASIIDNGILGGDKSHIIRMIVYMALLALSGLIAAVTAQYFSARAAIGTAAKIRSALFDHIVKLSAKDKDQIGTSTLITRLTNDTNQVQSCINMFLRLFLRSPFVVLGAAIMAFTVDSELAVIFALVIPVLSLIVFLIMRKTLPMFKLVQKKLDKLMLKTRENLYGVRVIRAFCREEEEKVEFGEISDELYSQQIATSSVSALLNPLTSFFINFGIILIIYFGREKFELGLIASGAIVALVNYMSQILVELVKFANLIVTITKGIASGNRIQSIFEIEPSVKSASNTDSIDKNSEEAVAFDKVSLTYKEGGSPAIRDISFKAMKGEKIGIIGATGSGKSTLVSLIGRSYDATEGSVAVFGTDVRLWPLENLKASVGIVPQKAVLFKGTIRENLKWGKEDASESDMELALKKAQALDFVLEKEKGLDAEVSQGGKNFSGGQRQRLSIARAFIKNPDILILDDSSSALDYKTDSELRKTISEIKDMTVFVVSQRTSSLLSMDRIIVLDKGAIVDIGSHSELLDSCSLYREIHFSQFEEDSNG
ncbi:MAG: ABC transporter ATP-binding protein [Spirochaetales bacterium]|nr:ABC transporter ATP-binding protein [Spirochaetales bacterium]